MHSRTRTPHPFTSYSIIQVALPLKPRPWMVRSRSFPWHLLHDRSLHLSGYNIIIYPQKRKFDNFISKPVWVLFKQSIYSMKIITNMIIKTWPHSLTKMQANLFDQTTHNASQTVCKSWCSMTFGCISMRTVPFYVFVAAYYMIYGTFWCNLLKPLTVAMT